MMLCISSVRTRSSLLDDLSNLLDRVIEAETTRNENKKSSKSSLMLKMYDFLLILLLQ